MGVHRFRDGCGIRVTEHQRMVDIGYLREKGILDRTVSDHPFGDRPHGCHHPIGIGLLLPQHISVVGNMIVDPEEIQSLLIEVLGDVLHLL